MNITIGSFRIESDATQFKLYQTKLMGEKSLTPGEETEGLVGYYSTIESLFRLLPTKALLRSDCKSLKEAMSVVEEYHRLITASLAGL